MEITLIGDCFSPDNILRMGMIFVLLLLSAASWGFDPSCVVDAVPAITTQVDDLALNLTNSCNFSELTKKRGGRSIEDLLEAPDASGSLKHRARIYLYQTYSETTNEEMCECLNLPNPLRDSLPSPDVNIIPNFLNRGIGEIFREELNNIQANVTKLKNLNLKQSADQRSRDVCSPVKIQEAVMALKQKLGSADCPVSESEFTTKTQDIFFGPNEQIAENLTNLPLETIGMDCMSRSTYARLRSSNSFNIAGLRLFKHHDYFRQGIIFDETENMASLLPYDLFFDLGFRDPEFMGKIAERVNFYDDVQDLSSHDVADKIYEDEIAQNAAADAIERQCGEFMQNIERFVCGGPNLKLETKMTNVIAAKTLRPDYEPPLSQAVIAQQTKVESCNLPVPISGHAKLLNDYLEEREMQSYLAQGPFSQQDDSEYKDFNKLFCPLGGTAQSVDSKDLSGLTKNFLENKFQQNPELKQLFDNEAVIGQLGFRIDLSATPIIVPAEDEDDYPRMNRAVWLGMKEELQARGLSELQFNQLYAILEMQTSSRRTELVAVRNRYQEQNPTAPEMSLREFDHILNLPPGSNAVVRGSNTPINADAVQQVYRQQESSRNNRFVPNNVTTALGSQVGRMASVLNTPVATPTATPETQTPQVTRNTITETLDGPVKAQPAVQPTPSVPTLRGGTTGVSSQVVSSKAEIPDKKSKPVTGNVSGADEQSSVISSRTENAETQKIKNEIKQIQDEIAKKQTEYDLNNQKIKRLTSKADAARIAPIGNAQTAFRENYNYPRNLPVRTESGQYYQPDGQGQELSSAAQDFSNAFASGNSSSSVNPASKINRVSSGGSSGAAATSEGKVASSSSASTGSGSGSGSGGSSEGSGRSPASVSEKSENPNVAIYEYPNFIPQSMIDMMGSIEKVVLLLGLEGKQFKTIESVEEIDPATGKMRIRYFERIYDFVPGNKFSEFKEAMKDKLQRAKLYESYFAYKRSPASLVKSRSYAKATKEVHKEEVEHSYVLENQNKILSEEEIRAKMAVSMELLK